MPDFNVDDERSSPEIPRYLTQYRGHQLPPPERFVPAPRQQVVVRRVIWWRVVLLLLLVVIPLLALVFLLVPIGSLYSEILGKPISRGSKWHVDPDFVRFLGLCVMAFVTGIGIGFLIVMVRKLSR